MLVQHDNPWPHYIIDNFLDQELFNKLISLRTHKNFKYVDSWDGKNVLTKDIGNCPSKTNLDIYCDLQLVDAITSNVKQQLSTVLLENYFYIPDLIKCDPGYLYPPHVDHQSKIYSVIVYLYPPRSNATILLKNKKKYSVQWKPNRALIIKNQPHTWHYYHNTTQYPRLTLNVYITQDNNNSFNVTTSEA